MSARALYVEKPMTHTAEEGLTVARRVKELHRVLQVGVQGTSWQRWHKIDGVGNEGDLKHVNNFLECVRTRNQPNCNADIGQKVTIATDLSVRSYRTGKVYYFDAEREQESDKS